MSDTAHLISEELLPDPKSVCFDGSNLHLINNLRQFFYEYNLTVIDNAEPNVLCLYQFVCGPLNLLKELPASILRECTKRVIIVQEATIKEAIDIGERFNAKVARIGNAALSKEEARVVFGLLFSEENKTITISEDKTNTSQKTQSQSKKEQRFETQKPKITAEHIQWERKEKEIQTLVQEIYTKKDPRKKRSYATFLLPLRYVFIVVSAFFSLHFLSLFVSLYLVASLLNGTTNRLSGILPSALEITVITGRVITQPFPQVTVNTFYKRVIDNLDRTGTILKEINSLRKFNNPVSAIANDSNESLLHLMEELKKSWGKISPILALMEGDIKLSKEQVLFSPQLVSLLDTTQQRLAVIREGGETLSSFSTIVTKLTSQEKKYLLLFQNSNELRPTGGFIGSVGFLTLKKNSFSSLTIEDVYTIDGQLRGHVDPPLPIRTILNQEHWYLRDSNWSPDFETSAIKALWFVNNSIGEQQEGVIGVSLSTIEELLAIIGPVELPDFQTTVDNNSIFTFIHKTTQEDFFPGSQKKRDVLTALSKAIELRLQHASEKELFQLSLLLAQKIKSRDVQFYSTDVSIQQELAQLKTTGSFPPQNLCNIPSELFCVKDLFAVVEANLAVNKTNAYVSREFSRNLILEEKEIVRHDSLKWKNTAGKDSTGGGNYTLYSRHYFPAGTSIQTITMNDTLLDIQTATMSSRPLPYAELIDEFPGVVTIGIAQDILAGKDSVLDITSTQPLPMTPHGYSLSVFRQAGVGEMPFSLTISSPKQRIETNADNNFLVANNGSFTYNRRLQRDEQVFIALTPEVP